MGAKGEEGQGVPNRKFGKATLCSDSHVHRGVIHRGQEGKGSWDMAGRGGPGKPAAFSGVPGILISIQLQPPEDCPRPGHEPPGNKQGQQPADWCVLLVPTM